MQYGKEAEIRTLRKLFKFFSFRAESIKKELNKPEGPGSEYLRGLRDGYCLVCTKLNVEGTRLTGKEFGHGS